MKLRRLFFVPLLPLLAIQAHGQATLTWDTNTGTSGAQDGAGTWNTSNTNWWNGTANTTFAANDNVIFGAAAVNAAYTVTLAATTSTGSLTFANTAAYPRYTLDLGGNTLTVNGQLSLNAQANAYYTAIANGTLALRRTGSTEASPDIFYDPNDGGDYGVIIGSTVDVGTGSRYIRGAPNRNSVGRYSGDLRFNGSLTGSANIFFSGTTVDGNQLMHYVLNANNSGFTGGVTLNASADLSLTNSAALSSANNVTFSPGTGIAALYLFGQSVTIGNLNDSGTGTRYIRNGARNTTNAGTNTSGGGLVALGVNADSVLTITQTTNGSFGGVISDGPNDDALGTSATDYRKLGIVKAGSATLTLSGTNTYTGGTAINNGILAITTAGALPGFDTSGKYSVANGATLAVYNAVTDANIASMLATTNFAAGSFLGFDTTSADRAYSVVLANTAQGALGLAKIGANTLTLSGSNSYTGGTAIKSGTLTITTTAALPGFGTNGSYSVAGGATLAVYNAVTDANITSMVGTTNFAASSFLGFDTTSGDRTYSAALADTAQGVLGLVKLGSSTLILSGNSSYSGPTNLLNGSIQLTGSLNTATTLGLGNSTNTTKFILGGASAVNQTVASIGTSGTGANSIVGGATTTSTLTVNNTSAATFSGTLGGALTNENNLALAKSGAATLTLSGANTYAGGTTVTAGGLSISNGSALGAGTVTFANVGTSLTITGTAVTLANNIVMPASGTGNVVLVTPNNSSTVLNGVLSGGAAGTVLFFQGGTVGQNTGALTLNGNNTGLSGAINVQRGPLILGNANAAGSTKIILDSNSPAAGALQLGNFSIANNVEFQSGASIGVGTGNAATVTGVLSSTAATVFSKLGAGSLTLTNANTYNGGTNVGAGTLLVNNTNVVTESGTGTGAVAVSAGATLGGTGRVAGATTVSGNLNAGNGGSNTETLAFGSTLNLTSAQKTTFDIAGSVRGTGYDGIDVTGALTNGGTLELNFTGILANGSYSFDLFSFASQSGSFSSVSLVGSYIGSLTNNGSGVWNLASSTNDLGTNWQFTQSTGDLTFTAVPEPTSAMAGLLLGAGWLRRRRVA